MCVCVYMYTHTHTHTNISIYRKWGRGIEFTRKPLFTNSNHAKSKVE